MEPTQETDPTERYDEALLQVRRDPRRLVACGLAATLAVLAVIAVVRDGHDPSATTKDHTAASVPEQAKPDRPHRTPDTTGQADEEESFIDRLLGDRYDGLFDGPAIDESTSSDDTRSHGSYSTGRCDFDLDVPDGWDTLNQQDVFLAFAPDDSAGVSVVCQPYTGKPLEEIADAMPSQIPDVGTVKVLDREALDGGYRLELSDEHGKEYRITWSISDDELWSVIEVYHQGDDDAAASADELAASMQPTDAS